MNITTGLMVKGLIGLGTVGAAAGGILVLKRAGSSSGNRDHVFYEKVEDIMRKVGLKGWCKRKGEKKYVCDGKSSAANLKKIRFVSKYSEDEYEIKNNYFNIEMEILESKDVDTFSEGIKFITKNKETYLSIFKKKLVGKSDWTYEIKVGVDGEYKFDEKKGGLRWVWQEINDLSGKVGLDCKEKDSTCTFIEGKKINIRDGENTVEGVALEKGKGLEFGRLLKNYFQSYRFVPKDDIEVKYDDGITSKPILKLFKNVSYKIERDGSDEMKWYLVKF